MECPERGRARGVVAGLVTTMGVPMVDGQLEGPSPVAVGAAPVVPPAIMSDMPAQALEFWTLGCMSAALGRRLGGLNRVRALLPGRVGAATR
jgi:hypothetical protein